jgi:hypothetical protein
MNNLNAMPKQVVIIRHGEKYTNPGKYYVQLNPKGLRRAGALASYLTLTDPSTTNVDFLENGPPTILFAARPIEIKDDFTIRCIQTISTVATTLRLPIHSGFASNQENELAEFILTSPECDNQNVLICWHHESIQTIVQALGYDFPNYIYPNNRFDLVWFMPTFPAPQPAVTLTPILQELLYGDSSVLP